MFKHIGLRPYVGIMLEDNYYNAKDIIYYPSYRKQTVYLERGVVYYIYILLPLSGQKYLTINADRILVIGILIKTLSEK